MPTVRLLDYRCHVVRMDARFPFRYGIAAMTTVPHVFFRGEFEIDGRSAHGFSADGLPPKWFTKNPATTFAEDLPEMLSAIDGAFEKGVAAGEAPRFFDWWHSLYQAQNSWATEGGIAPLLAHLGTSLVERAAIDAFCRATGAPLASAVKDNTLGIRLGEIHPDLAGVEPAVLMRQGLVSDQTLFVRHTVGLADPLTDADIPADERVADGLPQSLEASIGAYGLRWFKIKLCGDFDRDSGRLRQLAEVLGKQCPDYRFTLDGNEQFKTMASFRDHWERHRADPALREMLAEPRLIFVEQPVHRDEALAPHVGDDLAAWTDAPPLIIDESDGTLDAVRTALELGYAGTSHKNCKGVVKGIANACLLRHRQKDRVLIQSGEDLANAGPVALLQDLAAMHLLGIRHVERNGHHYFRGLEVFGQPINEAILDHHGDLYARHAEGFATPNVRQGAIAIGSVIGAPFGTAFRVDDCLAPWQTLDAWRKQGAFSAF